MQLTIRVAKSAGFCFGVSRAVGMVEGMLDRGERVCTLGPVIHNPRLVAELGARGAAVVDMPEQVPPGTAAVIRSHGVPRETYDRLRDAGVRVADATCPFVAKIHRIVADPAYEAVLIAGDPRHPEVEGIRGHCAVPSFVFSDRRELRQILAEHPALRTQKLAVVAQTTFHAELWTECSEFLKKVYTNAIIFDTICSATSVRQREAKELATESDFMVVVGGRQSSNTRKLYAVCAEICPSVLVEGADELPLDKLRRAGRIGVTAGASTPARIIKEVLNTMSGLDNDNNDNMEGEDLDFAAALEKSFKILTPDERVRGTVMSISPNEVEVDLGTKHAGYIPLSELTDDPSVKPDQMCKVGDEIDLVVLRVNDQDGTVMLSKKRVDAFKSWDKIVEAHENNVTVDGVVTNVIKGGLIASVHGVKVFIPASQSGVPRNGDLEVLLRKPAQMKIIEINEGRRRAVGSIRAVQREARKALAEKFWQTVKIGDEFTGKVKSLTSYGAFVDLGGVDGMVHVSELSWSRIKSPADVLSVGDTVNVYVKDLNMDTQKISLGYKDKGENPWNVFVRDYAPGEVIQVKIVSFMPFGAFAQIIPGVDGLIHISQIADHRVAKPQDELTMGEMVKVKITDIDTERKRISLSIREAEGDPLNGPTAEEEIAREKADNERIKEEEAVHKAEEARQAETEEAKAEEPEADEKDDKTEE